MGNNKKIWDYMLSTNLYDLNLTYDVPVFYILGDNDFQAPNTIAMKYFTSINAPMKKLYMQKDASHFMMLDNPREFAFILKDINQLVSNSFI